MSEDTKYPYWAFERLSRTIVKVMSIEGGMATLEDGTRAWLEALSQPAWLADAIEEMAEWDSEMETRQSVTEAGEQDVPHQVPLWRRQEAYGSSGSNKRKLFKGRNTTQKG